MFDWVVPWTPQVRQLVNLGTRRQAHGLKRAFSLGTVGPLFKSPAAMRIQPLMCRPDRLWQNILG
jgi:hypothetical protein